MGQFERSDAAWTLSAWGSKRFDSNRSLSGCAAARPLSPNAFSSLTMSRRIQVACWLGAALIGSIFVLLRLSPHTAQIKPSVTSSPRAVQNIQLIDPPENGFFSKRLDFE